jgi:predicted dehydrogenase
MTDAYEDRRPVRVGVIGAGNFARQQHIPNLAAMPDAELAALCEIDPETLDTVGERFGVPKSRRYTDAGTLLDSADIELVVVTVRDDLQPEIALQALAAGKHVYVEKPLSKSPEECLRVAQAAERSSNRLAVGFNKRFAPAYRKAREIIDDAGRPSSLHLAMTDDAWRWAHGYPPGYLMTLDVCHHIDLVEWFTGSPVASVYCRSSRPEDDLLLVTTESGAAATIMFSGNDAMDTPKEYARLIGERWSLTAEDFVELFVHGLPNHPASYRFPGHIQETGPFLHRRLMEKEGIAGWRSIRRIAWELHRSDQEPAGHGRDQREVPFIPNFIRDQGWYDSLREFVRGVADGRPTDHADARDAARVARVTEAAVASRKSGRVVDV